MKPVPTCRTLTAGRTYYRARNGSLHTVKKHYVTLKCDRCEFEVDLPTRLTKSHIEQIRKTHLGTCHFDELTAGTMQISEEELEFAV